MGMQEGSMMPALDALLNVVDNTGDRAHQGFIGVLPETHPLWDWILIEEVIKALYIQQ